MRIGCPATLCAPGKVHFFERQLIHVLIRTQLRYLASAVVNGAGPSSPRAAHSPPNHQDLLGGPHGWRGSRVWIKVTVHVAVTTTTFFLAKVDLLLQISVLHVD